MVKRLLVLLGCVCLLGIVGGSFRDGQPSSRGETRYFLIIDAGSSGSRIHVYKLRARQPGVLPHVSLPDPTFKVTPGLSSFADQPAMAGVSLQPLLEFARKNVPRAQHSTTPVLLMGTAGLRLLDAQPREAILESCRSALAHSPFMFSGSDSVRVISGEHEGVFAWVAINYASGALTSGRLGVLGRKAQQRRRPPQPVGVLEMGGASTQITFQADLKVPAAFAMDVGLAAVQPVQLFTHSFLSYGADEARRRALLPDRNPSGTSPCLPRGFLSPSGLRGTGSYDGCRDVALALLHEDNTPCSYTRCSIGNVPHPGISGDFIATEIFAYTVEALGLPPSASLQAISDSAATHCSKDWHTLRQSKRSQHDQDEELLKYCFSAAFIVAFLHDVLGISMSDTRVAFSNTVHSMAGDAMPVGWTLGAALYVSSHTNNQYVAPLPETLHLPSPMSSALALRPDSLGLESVRAERDRKLLPAVGFTSSSAAARTHFSAAWAAAWVAAAIVTIVCLRLFLPRTFNVFWLCGFKQSRVFFDLERGAYVQDFSERVKQAMTGVTGAVKQTMVGITTSRVAHTRSLGALLGTPSPLKPTRSLRTVV